MNVNTIFHLKFFINNLKRENLATKMIMVWSGIYEMLQENKAELKKYNGKYNTSLNFRIMILDL